MSIYEKLHEAAASGDVAAVKSALLKGADPKSNNSFALIRAAEHGHTECVTFLLPLSDPKEEDSMALRLAAENGHADCLKLLLPVSDVKQDDLHNSALRGHTECLKLLLTYLPSKIDDRFSLGYSSQYGYLDCLKVLIPVYTPFSKDFSVAISLAAKNGHIECVRALAPFSNMDSAKEIMSKGGYENAGMLDVVIQELALKEQFADFSKSNGEKVSL